MISFRSILFFFLVITMSVIGSGCTSVNTSEEDSMMELEGETSAQEVGDLEDEIAAADGGDAASEDFADETFSDEPAAAAEAPAAGGDDDFADFAEGDDLEQAFEDTLANEDLELDASESGEGEVAANQTGDVPLEQQLAEDTAFEEPLEPEPMDEEPAPITSPVVSGPPAEIRNIKFLANQSGGTVVIDGSSPLTHSTRVNTQNNQFVVEVSNAQLPDRLKRPYLLKEFPEASFGAINAYQDAGSSTVRVVIQMKAADFIEPVVQAEGNSLIVIPSGSGATSPVLAENPPVDQIESASQAESMVEEAQVSEVPGAGDLSNEQNSFDVASASIDQKALGSKSLNEFLTGNNKFYGRPISIQVKDADIRDVLNFIAGESGTNMILADEVKGTISLKLREIPWDQALVTVMKAKGLGYVREGSVIRINTLNNLEREAQDARRIVEAQRELDPLRVKVIPVSFAQVEALIEQIRPFLTQKRGNIVADPRTSSLIVTDTDEVLKKAERLVRELDVAPAQVIIEGKIVEAVENFNRTLGINWSASGSTIQLADKGGLNNGPINLSSTLGVTNLGSSTVQTPFSLDMQVGTLEFLGNLSAQLRLAETDNLVNVISSPRVVAMNKQKAKISQDSESIAISSVVEQGTVTKQVERVPVIVGLEVIPQITSDGSVIMDVIVERQFPGPIEDEETKARAINKRRAETRVLVKNGATAVIGGMYNSADTKSETGVPLLKKIPVVGWLFKSQAVTNEKNELLIFLTPRILNLQDQAARPVNEG